MEKEKKVNYSPPGWLVSIHEVKLDQERAQKLNDLRVRLCDATETINHINFPFISCNELWLKALDLLLSSEEEINKLLQQIKESK